MNDHLSDPKIILFQARALPSAEMRAALEHLAQCIHCRQRSHEHFQATNAYQSSTITLSPALQFRYEHLEAEQLTAFVNQSLDSEDKEIAQAHLQTCLECRSDVQSLLAFQEELKTELCHRYGPKPTPKQAWQWNSLWPAWQWKPVFAATFVAACLLATILVLLHQGEKQNTSPIAFASPSATASVIPPSPSASPVTSPSVTVPTPEETMIASLRDGAGMIAVTSTGNLAGIASVKDDLRGDIVAALRTGKLTKPAILNDLANDVETVRGKTTDKAGAQLRTPVGITVLPNRPVMHWQPVEKAIGYEVEIADGRGNEIARSERLPASTQRWQPPQALQRGVMYTWTVRAIHEEQAATALPPTGRFKVLGAIEAQELVRLKQQSQSHLVLGLFYVRAGMLPEAKQELKSLANKNPDSPLARKLLRAVQNWR